MAHLVPQEFELVPVDQLKPHPRNARVHSNATLDQSIAENGVYKPVVASRSSGYILAGHGLAERAQAAGIAEIPVVWLDGLSPAQELKIIAADNRTSDLGGYSETALAELLTSIRDETGGFEGTGYDQESFDAVVKAAGDAVLAAHSESEGDGEGAASDKSRPHCVVIECRTKQERDELIDKLRAEGLRCRVGIQGLAA